MEGREEEGIWAEEEEAPAVTAEEDEATAAAAEVWKKPKSLAHCRKSSNVSFSLSVTVEKLGLEEKGMGGRRESDERELLLRQTKEPNPNLEAQQPWWRPSLSIWIFTLKGLKNYHVK